MAGQADGSIIIDTELDSKGFEAGSAELLAAIKSLSNEVNTLGKNLRETFSGENKGVSATDNKIQDLEATIASLQSKVQSLKATVAELQAKLDSLSSGQNAAVPVDLNVGAAETKIAALESKIKELESTIARLQNGEGVNATPTVDFGGATEKTSDLQRQIDSVSSSVERLEPTFQRAMGGSESAIASFETKAGTLENKIADLQAKLASAGQVRTPTEDYKNLSAEIAKTAQKFDALLVRQEKMQAMGVKENSAQWQSLQYDMDAVSNKYHELLALKQQLETSGGAFITGADTAQYAQMEAGLAAANQRLAEMRAGLSQSGGLMSHVASGARSVFSWISSAASSIAGGFVSAIKTAVSHMAKMLTHSKSMKSQFGSLISSAKMFTMSLLGARSVYMLLRKVVNAYMQQNQQLAAQLSACWSGIGNILGPIITRLVSLVSTAVAYLTQFLSLLGFVGKSTSKAISSAGGGAAKAANKLKRQLASFDELNILSNDDSGGGGGGGGGAAGLSSELPEVTLPDWVKLMVDHLKSGEWGTAATVLTDQLNSMVANVDWPGVGDKLAYWLGGALAFLATAITTFDWFNLGVSLGTMINNLIYGVDWANLGIVLGWKFIALIEGLGGLFSTVDWAALGKSLADGLMGLWNAIDWNQAADTLSAGAIGALSYLSSAFKNVDWQQMGNDVAAFIASIDWTGVFTALSDGIGAALGGLAGFVWGLIEDAWAGVVDWWYEVAYEDGQFTIEGLLQGIWEGLCNIGQWVVDNVFTPFIDGFKSAFGINSPSTVMAEQGGYIVAGLLQGVTEAWLGVPDFFDEALSSLGLLLSEAWSSIKEEASTAWNKVGTTVSGSWSTLKTGVSNGASKVKETVSGAWDKIKTWTSEKWEKAEKSVGSAWESIQSETSTAADDVKASVSSAWSSVKDDVSTKLTDAKNSAAAAWGAIKSTANTTGTTIASDVSSAWSSVNAFVVSNLSSAKETAAAAWSSMGSTVKTVLSDIGNTVSSGFQNVHDAINEKVSSVKSTIASGFESIKTSIIEKINGAMTALKNLDWHSIGSNICTGIKNGINNGWSSLKTTISNLAKNLLNSAKSALGIHSPSRLFRDVVGLNIGYGIGEGIEASESAVLDSVVGVADAIAEEFNAGEYETGSIIRGTEIDGALMTFSDKITNGFTDLLERLQAIAENVTFVTPAVTNGVVPYHASRHAAPIEDESRAVHDTISSIMGDQVSAMMAGFEALLAENRMLRQVVENIDLGDTTIGQAASRYQQRVAIMRGG